MNNMIVKCLITNFTHSYRGFEYFFIAQGSLDYAPRFPPAVIFIFPRNETACEVGMMTFTSAALKLSQFCNLPDKTETMRVWKRLCTDYPKFSEIMRDVQIQSEYITQIPNAKNFVSSMTVPGLVLLGDAIGFIEASGASGISATLQSAKVCIEFLAQNRNHHWDPQLQERYTTHFQTSIIARHINKVYRIILTVLNYIFAGMRTAKKINQRWWLIHLLYRLG
jgi:flavin-dependent dehydrogenase